jgi:hypothetical protein
MPGALRLTYERGISRGKIKGGEAVKYILLMNTMKMGDDGMGKWPKKDQQAHIAYWNTLNKELAESGELVVVEGLAFPDQAKLVRASQDGTPATDGVFPESKEFLAGYWIVDVETPDRAYVIAARASTAPGPGGAPLNMPIEVRQVMMSVRPDELL